MLHCSYWAPHIVFILLLLLLLLLRRNLFISVTRSCWRSGRSCKSEWTSCSAKWRTARPLLPLSARARPRAPSPLCRPLSDTTLTAQQTPNPTWEKLTKGGKSVGRTRRWRTATEQESDAFLPLTGRAESALLQPYCTLPPGSRGHVTRIVRT